MTTPSFFITPGYGTRLHDALHYSQAMRIGDRVEISGQGGWNDDLVIPESIEEEIEQAFKEAVGARALRAGTVTVKPSTVSVTCFSAFEAGVP